MDWQDVLSEKQVDIARYMVEVGIAGAQVAEGFYDSLDIRLMRVWYLASISFDAFRKLLIESQHVNDYFV